ncbi:MAG: hypothetical protein AAGC78_17780 [Cellvibrio sp.]|uniref:hypothetical protein n=1 Tax=Cellvibrio sp. TaxID=1965322 RepID=UPI0031A2F46D
MLAASVIKKPTVSGRFFSGLTLHSRSPRWIAIAITVIVHLLVLWGLLRSTGFIPAKESRVTQLRYITLPAQNEPEKVRAIESFTLSSGFTSQELLPAKLQQLPEFVTEVEPLTQQELNEIIGRSNYPSQNNTQGIARNVFHPGLREQLAIEENKPVLARVEDSALETHTDPSGATVVKLGSGKCLRSPSVKSGEARNWYMTSCGGKTESEEMLERVDMDVNGKRRFGEPN